MRKVVFLLGTPEWRAVQRREMLLDWTYQTLDGIARKLGIDASIVFAVSDPFLASKSKTEIGIERIRAERPRMLDEVAATGADLVMCFGPVAAAAMFDHGSMTEGALQRRRHKPLGDDGPEVYYTSSIEQIKMSPGMVDWWSLDITAALRGYDKPVVAPFDLNPAGDPLFGGPGHFNTSRLVGFDLETTGLNPWASNAAIRMMVFSWRSDQDIMRTAVYDWDKLPSFVLQILADPQFTKVGANIAFDVRWCKRFGVEVNNYVDVLTLEHVLHPGNARLTLKDLGFKYFPQVGNYNAKVEELAKAAGDDWSKIPAEEMYEYCAADGQVSLVAAEQQLAALAAGPQGLEGAAHLLRDLYPILTDMTAAGARIDPATNAELDALYQGKLAQLKGEITQILGPINLNSPDQLAAALKKAVPGIDLSLRRIKKALDDNRRIGGVGSSASYELEEEEVSTDRRTLEREAAKHPVIGLILEHRKYRVRHSTFIEGLREKHLVAHHGAEWVHPDFRSDVTDTYRLSSRNPNGQNMPRNDPDANLSVKRQFVSRFEGGEILEIDMSQIELRVAAWFSGDRRMQDAFAAGVDIHRSMAGQMLNKAPETVTDEERQSAKTRTFLIMYGGGATKLADELKVSTKRASELIKQYFATYPQLKRAIDETHQAVQLSCDVTTPFGFQRTFFPPDNWMTADGWQVRRQAWNTIIQNTAACLMYCAMIRVRELMDAGRTTYFPTVAQGPNVRGVITGMTLAYKSLPFLQIHDSLVFDVAPRERESLARIVQQAFREAPMVAARYGVTFDMPLEADIKIGPNWGEGTKL
jgi:DNA polymerase-1